MDNYYYKQAKREREHAADEEATRKQAGTLTNEDIWGHYEYGQRAGEKK